MLLAPGSFLRQLTWLVVMRGDRRRKFKKHVTKTFFWYFFMTKNWSFLSSTFLLIYCFPVDVIHCWGKSKARIVLCKNFSASLSFRFLGLVNYLPPILGLVWVFLGVFGDCNTSLILQLDFPIGRTTGPSSSCCWHCLFFLCPLLSWNVPWAYKLTPKGVFMHVILCVDCFLFGNDIWREGFQKTSNSGWYFEW